MSILRPIIGRLDKCEFDASHKCTRRGYQREGPFADPKSFMTCPAGRTVVVGYMFWRPACKERHSFRTAKYELDPVERPMWSFDGNMESPTFAPSLRYLTGTRCHLFVKAGTIEYCTDCPHEFAGKTVPMVPIPDGE